jgi:hypothetical protein
VDTALRTVLRGVQHILEQEGVSGHDWSPERVATLVGHHIRATLAAEPPDVVDVVVASALLWAVALYEGPRLFDGQHPGA